MNNPENKESMDMLLFDYLEGNLSEEKAIEFEKELASDLSLQEELGIWKSAHIDSEDYDTAEIESTILNKTIPSYHITSFLNMFLIGCVVFISSVQPKVDGHHSPLMEMGELDEFNVTTEKSALTEEKSTSIVEEGTVITEEKTEFTELARIPVQATIKPTHEVLIEKTIDQKIDRIQVTVIEKLPICSDTYLMTLTIQTKSTATSKTSVRKKPDRKALKGIRKMKKKAIEDRMANEFIKGNVPYVVPINTSNF